MYQIEPLAPGQYYHIYNCGINGTPLFTNTTDYERFLHLYERFIEPVAETFAWCLMGNHFHLLVRIKENIIYKYANHESVAYPDSVFRPVRMNDTNNFELYKWETIQIKNNNESSSSSKDNLSCPADDDRLSNAISIKIPKPHLHFSHLFNAYSKYFNKKYNRHGSLFERPFKRKLVDDNHYLMHLILYIHNNPVHHEFVEHPLEYTWSSYITCISVHPTKLQREKVVGWFDGEANFKQLHNGKFEIKKLEEWLEL
jgi:putative transposase